MRGKFMKKNDSKKKKMEILVNTSFEETRIAILENDRLSELLWERRNTLNIVGNIYKANVENVLPGISSAFVNIGYEKNAYLYISDVIGHEKYPIDRLLKRNQQIMVQVVKDAIGTKGMKVTMDVTLPGRYLVLTPYQSYVGVSKNIEDAARRKELNDLVQKMAKEHLKDMDLVLQVARDLLCEDVEIYLLDNQQDYKHVMDFVTKISPEVKSRVKFYTGKKAIFSAFGVDSAIDELRKIKIGLPSGGSIIIQEAESLCAIDVNTGKFTGKKSQEETVTSTNIEAASEVAHQLRLRNIGGIIVIDFIDMRRASNRHKVMDALTKAVRDDRAKIRILPITRLGLVEMTRERKRESTGSLLTENCPECNGSGRVLSAESMRIKIQREVQDLTHSRPGGKLRIVLHPTLCESLKQKQSLIERSVHRSIKIQSDPQLTWEDYRIILE
jgi:ribonuclease G